ncbi:MAG TPA: hypothetical protein VFM96_10130 [Gaiellaceae bacterium]|nr:hypothetical protein [Gaiellaceae bacterium]
MVQFVEPARGFCGTVKTLDDHAGIGTTDLPARLSTAHLDELELRCLGHAATTSGE